jgi:multiple antibiotic resistance protein
MEFVSAVLALFLVMDPVGNVPVFTSYLAEVAERRRPRVVVRESIVALVILVAFLLFGPTMMRLLHVEQPSLHLAGGTLLFLISLSMIFPGMCRFTADGEEQGRGEPFIVPLATPFLAGPSTIATIMIFVSREPRLFWQWLAALVVAWALTTMILMLSAPLTRLLGTRWLLACERLMGMILTVIAVQMFLNGVKLFMEAMEG